MDVGKRISEMRFARGLTARELGKRVGVSQSYISLLENGKRRLSVPLLGKIAEVLSLSLAQFFSDVDAVAQPGGRPGVDLDRLYASGELHSPAEAAGSVAPIKMRAIPLVSRVAAGDPAGFTDGEYPADLAEKFVPSPADVDDPNAFAFRIHDDSMAPRFSDGDLVICSPRALPAEGDAVVAKVRGKETTCKVLHLDDGSFVLSPVNPDYPTLVYPKAEIDWMYPVVICQHREKW